MALVFADRVKETTTTAGTGAVTLAGAVTGYQSFTSGIGNGNTCYYCIASQTLGTWEVGLGTYSTTGPTLTRTTPLAGSSATPVTFGSETKDVFVTSPALWASAPAFTGAISATTFNGNTFTTGTYTLTGTAAKTLNFTNSLTLTGTDSTTMTFPTSTATIARTDAAQTFTGVQTFAGVVANPLNVGSSVTTNAPIYFAPSTTLQYNLMIQGTNTFATVSGTPTGVYINPSMNGTANSGALVGLQVTPIFNPLVAVGNIYATSSVAYLNSSFAPSNVMAVRGVIQLSANSLTGTITNAYSFYANAPSIDASATTTITNVIQFRAENITKGTAQTITNAYAFYGSQGTGSATNSWNLYMAGAAPNWLNGSLYLGGTTATSAILTGRSAANLTLGLADAAAPVAQTLSVQNVVAGTTDTAGTNFTITGSRGTGTGAGGSILFQTAAASTTGSTQNALATALTIASTGTVTAGALVATTLNGNTFTTGTYTLTGTAAKTLNFTNTLTLSGTDSTVMTFPTTSATIARTDAAQTFTGIQTFTAPVLGTPGSGTLSNCTVDGTAGNNVGFINIPQLSKTAAYILAAADRGKHVSITTGGVTVNVSTFAAGDAVTIFNNSASAQTITQGTSATMYLAGTATTGNRTLAQRGICTILCITGGASAVYVISGAGLT